MPQQNQLGNDYQTLRALEEANHLNEGIII